ncbi:MAG: PRD domain-containing protein [Streptococcus sp.]|nr:PRD domain-containing protein [Streptococcus sp.]
MYQIISSMNNNVTLAQDVNGEEVVLIGSGIGFNKNKGDTINEEKIEKIFHLRTEESKENFISLLKNIPLDFITVTYDVVDYLSKKYHYPVQEYIYVTLTDHIYCSYQALVAGKYKPSSLPDVSSKYPIPYQIGQEALDIYRKNLLESLPNEEVSRIAYHFMNAEGVMILQKEKNLEVRKNILHLIDGVLEKNNIKRTSENSNFYDRFMIHLNYFLDYLDRSRDDNQSLLDMEDHIKQSYPKAFEIGSKIYDVITQHTGLDLYKSERVYLVLHIQRLLS